MPAFDHHHLDGRRIGAEIIETVRTELQGLSATGWTPQLVSVSIGQTGAVEV